MNEAVQQTLRELIGKYGHGLCDDPRRCEGLLRDLSGKNRREIAVIVGALKEGVPRRLLDADKNIPFAAVINQLSDCLANDIALSQDAARWATESWVLALGLGLPPQPSDDREKSGGIAASGKATRTGTTADVSHEEASRQPEMIEHRKLPERERRLVQELDPCDPSVYYYDCGIRYHNTGQYSLAVDNFSQALARSVLPLQARKAIVRSLNMSIQEQVQGLKTSGQSGFNFTSIRQQADVKAVIAQTLVSNWMKSVAAGADSAAIERGIEGATARAVEELKRISTRVENKDQLAEIAPVLSYDSAMGKAIVDTMEKVGIDGVVFVDDYGGLALEIEYVEGMRFSPGYISPCFITNPEQMRAEIEDPYILITNKSVWAISDILPSLEKIVKISKNVVIIAEDVGGESLATLVFNKSKGTLSPLAIRAPGSGDTREAMLQDIAVITGGTVLSEGEGTGLAAMTLEHLGRARKVIADKDSTTIVEGRGEVRAIEARIKEIRAQVDMSTSGYDKDKLWERLARMAGGVAVLKIGALSESVLKNEKLMMEDAVLAISAAAQEGVVPGGALALLQAASALDDLDLGGDEATGAEILKRALEDSSRMLGQSTGQDAMQTMDTVREKGIRLCVERGLIAPTKAVRSTVKHAVDLAVMILTSDHRG